MLLLYMCMYCMSCVIYVCAYVHIHTYIRMCVRTYTYICAYIRTYAYIRMCVRTYTYIRTYVCAFIHMYLMYYGVRSYSICRNDVERKWQCTNSYIRHLWDVGICTLHPVQPNSVRLYSHLAPCMSSPVHV